LHQRIPGSRLEILQGVGHMPMLEAPQKLAEAILGFLAE
jgi:pimeloyl-ACP methyl ester carboxylesterase